MADGCSAQPDVSSMSFVFCASVLLFKKCQDDQDSGRTHAEFLLDASKQLIGLQWIRMLDAQGLVTAEGAQRSITCAWSLACAVVEAVVGVFLEYVLLRTLTYALGRGITVWMRVRKVDMLREEFGLDDALTWEQVVLTVCAERGIEAYGTTAEQADRLFDELGLSLDLQESPAADFDSGDYRDVQGDLAFRKYAKQLLVWLGCIAGMRLSVVFVLSEFHTAFVDIAELALLPVSWNGGLQWAVAAALIPFCLQLLQVWITDEFLRRGGLPVAELRQRLARGAKSMWARLPFGRGEGCHYNHLQRALLQSGTVEGVPASAGGDRSAEGCAGRVDLQEVVVVQPWTSARTVPHGSARRSPRVEEPRPEEARAPQAQREQRLGLEEGLGGPGPDLESRIGAVEEVCGQLLREKVEALSASLQLPDGACDQQGPPQQSASVGSPGLLGPLQGLPQPAAALQHDLHGAWPTCSPGQPRSPGEVRGRGISGSEAQLATSLDQRLTMLEAKIGMPLQSTRLEDAICKFQVAGEVAIQEFLSRARRSVPEGAA